MEEYKLTRTTIKYWYIYDSYTRYKKMKRYLKINDIERRIIQIKDLEETEINEFEDIEEIEDENAEVVEKKITKRLG